MSHSVAVCIGSFDGVHRGHQAILRAAREALDGGGRVVAVTFDPHPGAVLRPALAPRRLTTIAQRTDCLRAAGADEVEVLEPTADLLGQTPEAFVASIKDRHRPRVIVEGPDFRFGRDRAGTVETLRSLEAAGGFRTLIIDPVEVALVDHHLVRVSSTMARRLIEDGRVRDAAALLGRPYELEGTVVPGDRRGRDLGVPTANLDHRDYVLPADGIYAGAAVTPDGRRFPAAVSVGTKPTFGENPRVIEAHLVGFDGPVDEYGWTLRLALTGWIRDQIRYDDVTALRRQIDRDIARAAAAPAGTMEMTAVTR